MNSRKNIFFLFFITIFLHAEVEEYSVELIILKVSGYEQSERFLNNLDFNPKKIIQLIPKSYEVNTNTILKSVSSEEGIKLMDVDLKQNNPPNLLENLSHSNTNTSEEKVINPSSWFFEENIQNLDYLLGRLKWRDNVTILSKHAWLQPIHSNNEHYVYLNDNINDISVFLNLYQSRYLHADLVAFEGSLDLDNNYGDTIKLFFNQKLIGDTSENIQMDSNSILSVPIDNIKVFIKDDRLIKESQINFFDHPKFGILLIVSKLN